MEFFLSSTLQWYFLYFVHYRSARTLSKQLRYNHHWVSLKTYHGEKSAVIMMGIVIGVFIITYGMYLHCSFLILFDTTGMASCNDAKYKIQPSEAFYVRACHIFSSTKISPRRPNPDSSRLRPGSLQIPQNFKGGWSNVKFF